MQTVIETPDYLRDAETAGLSEEEQENVVTMIATNPKCGDMIPGTGGCRKIRVRGRGKGAIASSPILVGMTCLYFF